MPKIIPITDLRNTTDVSGICHESNEPIFITKNGYGDMVIMSMEAYDNLLSSLSIDSAIAASEAELKQSGDLHNAEDVFSALRRKHFENV